MENALWDSIVSGPSVSNHNVQKRDQHRKKNCAVENCNAVVFRMTHFCHRHQNETLTSPKTNDSEGNNSESQNWWESEEPPSLPDTISKDTPQNSRAIPITLLAGILFFGPGGFCSSHWLSPIHRFHKARTRILRPLNGNFWINCWSVLLDVFRSRGGSSERGFEREIRRNQIRCNQQ